eukprot:5982308-Pyramimonas_sp.AAC.1
MLQDWARPPQSGRIGFGRGLVLLLQVGLEILDELPLLGVGADEVGGGGLERVTRGKLQRVPFE